VVPVRDGDTAESLAARVLTAEHRLYREAVRKVAGGAVETDEGARVISLG
jgi:phosphoribosylglycinamide formyltransferase 1